MNKIFFIKSSLILLEYILLHLLLKLKDGLNTIEFFALNEGTASPNTAELKVFDENSAIIGSGQWLLTTGYKARLIVLHQ